MGGIFIASILYFSAFCLINQVVNNFNDGIGIDFTESIYSLTSMNEYLENVRSFSHDKLEIFHIWYLLQMCGMFFVSYLMMFYIPEIIYKTLNPFKAFINSIKNLFKKFFPSLGLFLYLNILYLLISIINSILITHPFCYVLILILFYYYIIYATSLIFTYYEWEFVANG